MKANYSLCIRKLYNWGKCIISTKSIKLKLHIECGHNCVKNNNNNNNNSRQYVEKRLDYLKIPKNLNRGLVFSSTFSCCPVLYNKHTIFIIKRNDNIELLLKSKDTGPIISLI